MIIRRTGRGATGEDSFSFRMKFTTVDVKKSLQKWLRMELDNDIYGLHCEEEIRTYFSENTFGYLSSWFVRDVAEWAFRLALRWGYICRSNHDMDSPVPLFYVPLALLDVKCGPKLNVAEQYKNAYDVKAGSSALFEEQKPITKLEIKNDKFKKYKHGKGKNGSADSTGECDGDEGRC